MYLVAKEVMTDLEKLRLLPWLFNKEPADNPNVMIDQALLDKVWILLMFQSLDYLEYQACGCRSFAGRRSCLADVSPSFRNPIQILAVVMILLVRPSLQACVNTPLTSLQQQSLVMISSLESHHILFLSSKTISLDLWPIVD